MIVSRYLTDIASASTASDIQLGSCATEIGAGAFSGFTNISEVELPENLTTIGYSAFTNSSLTKVTIPSGVTSIGKDAFKFGTRDRRYTVVMDGTTPPTLGSLAFSKTYLNNIYVPAEAYNYYVQAWPDYSDYIVYNGINYKVTLIDATDKIIIHCNNSDEVTKNDIKISATTTMFGSCATSIGDLSNEYLGDVIFSSSVKNIRNNAFNGASISSLTFAEGLETIGEYSFSKIGKQNSSGVTSIDLPKSLKSISRNAFDSVELDRLTINGDSGVILGNSIFSNKCSINNLIFSNVETIPERLCAYTNSTGRFYNVEIKNTNSSITNISVSAFTSNVVKSASIDNANIGDYAFEKNSNLVSVFIKSGTIGKSSFINCSGITSCTIGSGVTSIGGSAFARCYRLTSVTIPNSVTSIGGSAFYDCIGLTSCTIGSGVTSIGDEAFSWCSSLTSINIPSGVTSIDYGVFSNCKNLRKLNSNTDGFLNIPNSITSIGGIAFSYCSGFTSCTIGSGVTSIGDEAFSWCSSLTSIDIPSNVLSIGKEAFYECSNLSKITIRRTTPPTLGSGAFDGSYCLIYVPANSYELYINAENWSNYKSRIYYDGITNYKALLKDGDSSNNSKIVPCDSSSALTSSDTSDFHTTNGIAIIGDCVTTIGSGAFQYNYKTVKISDSVTTIESNAFQDLKVFEGGKNITTIGDSGFTYCSSLTSIAIPKIERIGNRAFYGCDGLTSVQLGDSLISIGDYAFSGCSKAFTSLELKNGVIVGDYAFARCGTLTSATIDTNSIGSGVFEECTALNSINIGSSTTIISDNMFSNCYSLRSVTIPDSVTSIGYYAFGYCKDISSITINAVTPPTLREGAFYGIYNYIIYVPSGSLEAYKSASEWSGYADRIQPIPNS